jgi:hypothetical protein
MLKALVAQRKKQGEELTWADEERMEGKQELILRQTRHKFGTVPESVVKRLEEIMDDDILDDLAIRVVDAATLADMGLSGGDSS